MINEDLSRRNFEELWGNDSEPIGVGTKLPSRFGRDARILVMTSNDSLELQTILTELQGLLDGVLQIMYRPSGIQVNDAPVNTRTSVIDGLITAINDAAVDVLQALELIDVNAASRPTGEGNTQEHSPTWPMPRGLSVSEEALRNCLGGPELPGLETLVSVLAHQSNRVDFSPEETIDVTRPDQAPSRRRLSRFHHHRLGWASLSDTERRVAELVSLGLTDRQVGRQMFVSRQVVEEHLRNVLAKLNITSREELERYALIWSTLP